MASRLPESLPCRQAHPERLFVCSKFAWSRTGVATEDANAFFPSAESTLFCANFAVVPGWPVQKPAIHIDFVCHQGMPFLPSTERSSHGKQ